MITVDDAQAAVGQAEASQQLSPPAASAIRRWLTESPFAQYRPRLLEDIEAKRWKTLDDAFFAVLEFGTGGRRGVMYPVGTNVLNARTMAESARGLADYVTGRKGEGSPRSCVIARDSRHNSPEFADLCARVLAAAGFTVYLFPEARSTPLLSFAVRHLKCDAGIMITASHNPPSDNGFKCYAATGGQVIPPDDAGIIGCVKEVSDGEIPEMPLDRAKAEGKLVLVGAEVDEAYIASVVGESVGNARDISIVYTPLHGVGETSVAAALATAGFKRVNILASQRTPDGDFPNVPNHVANPENPSALEAAIAEAKATGADLVLASDPDADRIGVGLPATADKAGPWVTLDGNQIGVLIAAFVMKEMEARGKLRSDHYLVTTLVSTQMTAAIGKREGIKTEDDLLVGFKWIGERIDREGPAGFLFGFEESHGYLKGTYARDKDAAVASLLFAELAATVKDRNQTVLEYLDDLYVDVGHYGEHLINKTYKGREGVEQIKALMAAFRSGPPKSVGGAEVTEVYDYQAHEIRALKGTAAARPLPHPSGDLLIFHTSVPGVRFAARPSGTEPKIKFYLFARSEVKGPGKLAEAKAETRTRLDHMVRDIEEYVTAALARPS
ncbi:Phosphoglucomutase [Aquisphaera giovannonii]|uniref:Phosphoglucomutase n=1 Tax=Aquisphaera giovannonii TaxID=406548 RepID=A0A5B9W811_9BACT|nr:phospho-sugar mutase [Aquisphaera giovannonii]QEH36826.1 Phosphoglucomutase [Aquisphaera giovannonii]